MESNILIESGTNELEVLDFMIGNNHYGINVAKVREIVPMETITPVPNSHPSIEGIFMPRDTMITVVNLAKQIKLKESTDSQNDMLIITNFNMLDVAFHVQKVVGIHRVSWADIITPDKTVNNDENGIATGIVKIDGELIIILDFERIVAEICPETGLKVSDIDKMQFRKNNNSHIVIAEDSPLLIKLISDSLNKAGYTNLTLCSNGQEAWDYISKEQINGTSDDIKCLITDLEMPLMDGHRLTKLVKSDDDLKRIPVVIFSSMINEQMKAKGESVGADVQLSKPEIGKLVEEIDKLL